MSLKVFYQHEALAQLFLEKVNMFWYSKLVKLELPTRFYVSF